MDVYTAAQAAAALGIHQKTVVRWCRRGTIPGARLHYGSAKLGWRIPKSAIERMLHGGNDPRLIEHFDDAAEAARAGAAVAPRGRA